MDSIFNYSDYREYLRDYYESHKALNSNFSFRYLSQKAGINSSGYYKEIIENKRNLSRATVLKTCSALSLKDREAEFFENLVLFNQSKTLEEKNHFFKKTIEMQKARNVKQIHAEQFEYYNQWYHCVIRELATFVDFDEKSTKNWPVSQITSTKTMFRVSSKNYQQIHSSALQIAKNGPFLCHFWTNPGLSGKFELFKFELFLDKS